MFGYCSVKEFILNLASTNCESQISEHSINWIYEWKILYNKKKYIYVLCMTQQVQVLRGAIRAPQVNFLFEHKNKMTEVICN